MASCGGDEPSDSADARPAGYCDELTPCTDSARNYCDLDGSYPASEGQPNTCIPDPALAECSPTEECSSEDEPHCSNSGQCVECLNFSHCNADAPVCSLTTHTCGGCRSGEEGNAICQAIDPLQPFCSEAGGCVACLDNSHCEIVSAPICDPTELACRGCASTDECETGTCNTVTGVCEL